jgi:Alw26I/Eco31I/Esp3I family type II restriction m6 adenine DNA methyltransferase
MFEKLKRYYPDATGGMINIFRFFIVRSISLLKDKGCFCEIFPLSFTGDESVKKLRKNILDNYKISSIEAFPERDDVNRRVFQAVKMSVCIMSLTKERSAESFYIRVNTDRFVDEKAEKVFLSAAEDIKLFDPSGFSIPMLGLDDRNILRKIYSSNRRFGDFSRCYDGEVHLTKYKNCITDDGDNDAPLIKGAIIDRYLVRTKMSQGTIQYLNKNLYLSSNKGSKSQHYKNPRIVMQRITGVNEKTRIKSTIIESGIFCANSIGYLVLSPESASMKIVLAILNSKLSNYIFKLFSTNSNVNGYEIENLPFPSLIPVEIEESLNNLVERILAMRKEDKNTDVTHLESQINQLVYKLYDLSDAEKKTVERTA